jgi:lipopolysaccharide transport system ATP-binding protein
MSSPVTSNPQLATSSTADQEVLVKVEGVSKKFCRSLKRSLWYGVCDIAGELSPFGRRPRIAEVTSHESRVTGEDFASGGNNPRVTSHQPLATASPCGDAQPATSHSPLVTPNGLRPGEFWAVNDVSFELRRGECLGLIGHNGAGKTTLIKMVNGLIKPDRGRIEMNGRVGALIALGAGFNPILTGRENIYINGSVLGLSKKEIDEKIEEIIDFAEIGEFIDMPVQNYSSGMTVRLGFAVATTLNPDILILDEVLAVGDASFRAKCYSRIGKIQQQAAVIFVSHSMDQVGNVCSRICGLSKGRARLFSDKESGIQWYHDQGLCLTESTDQVEHLAESVSGFECQNIPPSISYGQTIQLVAMVKVNSAVSSVAARLVLYSPEGTIVAEWNSGNLKHRQIKLSLGMNTIDFPLGPLHLKRGLYSLGILLQDASTRENLVWSHRKHQIDIEGPSLGASCYVLP